MIFSKQDFIGKRFICRSNEDEPLLIGLCEGFTYFANDTFPNIIGENDGIVRMVMGVIIPFHQGMVDFLNTMSYKEQWEYLSNLSNVITIRQTR
jgi:hypothetical protein